MKWHGSKTKFLVRKVNSTITLQHHVEKNELNGDKTYDFIKEFNPEIVLSFGCSKLDQHLTSKLNLPLEHSWRVFTTLPWRDHTFLAKLLFRASDDRMTRMRQLML